MEAHLRDNYWMTPLIHNYTHKAGRTFLWDTSDNIEWYQKNINEPATRQRLVDLGFLDVPIEYSYNTHGFRTAEFDQQFDIVCFGCSFTLGTGVHAQDNWPSQLTQITGMTTANLGHAGSSNDTAFRFAQYYLPSLKPKYAVWLQTDRHRVELLDDATPLSINIMAGDTHNPCAGDYFIKTWFSSDSNQQLNLQKNTLAFEQLCQQLGIKSIVLKRSSIETLPFPLNDARDLIHPGANTYRALAQNISSLL